MDISIGKYIKLLLAAAFIMGVYINSKKEKEVKSISPDNKEERKEASKWTGDDWGLFFGGCVIGAPLIDGLVSGIYLLFN